MRPFCQLRIRTSRIRHMQKGPALLRGLPVSLVGTRQMGVARNPRRRFGSTPITLTCQSSYPSKTPRELGAGPSSSLRSRRGGRSPPPPSLRSPWGRSRGFAAPPSRRDHGRGPRPPHATAIGASGHGRGLRRRRPSRLGRDHRGLSRAGTVAPSRGGSWSSSSARFLIDDAHRQANLAARVDLEDLDLTSWPS